MIAGLDASGNAARMAVGLVVEPGRLGAVLAEAAGGGSLSAGIMSATIWAAGAMFALGLAVYVVVLALYAVPVWRRGPWT